MEIAYLQSERGPIDARGEPSRGTGERWLRRRIDAAGLDLTLGADSTPCVEPASRGGRAEPLATILPHGAGDLGGAVLLLRSRPSREIALLVDGFPPLTVTELTDGAEISVGTDSFYVHRDGRSELEVFAGPEHERCARCKRAFVHGDVLRRCGLCAVAHHEGPTADPALPDLFCASYDPKCARCGEPWEATAPAEVPDAR